MPKISDLKIHYLYLYKYVSPVSALSILSRKQFLSLHLRPLTQSSPLLQGQFLLMFSHFIIKYQCKFFRPIKPNNHLPCLGEWISVPGNILRPFSWISYIFYVIACGFISQMQKSYKPSPIIKLSYIFIWLFNFFRDTKLS